MLKGRAVQLLQLFLQQRESVSTYELAAAFNVKVRTVQEDLAELDEWMKNMQWNASLVRTGSSVALQVGEEERDSILQFIHAQNPRVKVYAQEERRLLILLELFKRDEPMIVKELEIDFRVSESTILRDLNELQQWVEERGLTLIRKPNFGVQLTGSELEWRMAAFDLISAYLETVNRIKVPDLLVQLQYGNLATEQLQYTHFVALEWLLSEGDFRTAQRLLQRTVQLQNSQLTDGALASLLVHIAVAIHRMRKGKCIVLPPDQRQYIEQSVAYTTANLFAQQLADHLSGLCFTDEETAYVAMHVAGSRFIRYGEQFDVDMAAMTDRLIKTLEGFTQLELRHDESFVSGLHAHLRPMLARLKFGIPIRNELLQEVKEKYPSLYTATKLAVLAVGDKLPAPVPDDEIGYLTLHVGAVIERKRSGQPKRKRVVLVCGSGVGTSNLLLVQLAREFPELEIVGCKHAFEVQELASDRVDLIVSTIDIRHPSIPVICIRPILRKADLEQLRLTLNERLPSSVYWEEVIDQIVSEARRKGMVNTSVFRQSVRQLIYERLFAATVDGEKRLGEDERPLLQDLLHEQTVSVVERCTDWKSAVQSVGKMLLQAGSVEPDYVDAMVRVINEHGPYVVVAPGIALVHARPEDGVNDVCMSLLVCSEGVAFGNPEKDPVQLIFAFGAVDDNEHLRALSQMMTLLNDKNAIGQLKAAASIKEALTVLRESVKQA